MREALQAIKLSHHPYHLPFKIPWQTAKGKLFTRHGFILRLQTDLGLVGIGDCAPMPEMGTESMPKAIQIFDKLQHDWHEQRIKLPLSFELDSEYRRTIPPALMMALETAIYDILSQGEGISLGRYLNPEAANDCRLNANIGPLDENIIERAKQAIQKGFHCLKIKTAVYDIRDEIKRVEQLAVYFNPISSQNKDADEKADSETSNSGIQWRFDANQGWTFSQAQQFIARVKQLPHFDIHYMEEPLQSPELKTLARLQDLADFPIAIDESLASIGLDQIIRFGGLKHLVIKAGVVGGISTLQNIQQRCETAGIQVILTSLLESAVGIQASLHFASAYHHNIAQGLATSHYLADDLTTPPTISNGRAHLQHSPGLGLSFENLNLIE